MPEPNGLAEPGVSRTAHVPRVALIAAAAIAALAGLVHLVWLTTVFFGRARFPLDLEWMEGGELVHALRLARGQPLYVEPSLEFIPFLYTPFYPALVAALSHVLPLGYALGRGLSIAAFFGALAALTTVTIRKPGWGGGSALEDQPGPARSRLAVASALAAAGTVAAGFVFSGSFYDLVRADSLLLLLQVLALVLLVGGRRARSAAAAGGIIALAFFTKQTASLMGGALGLACLIANWRRALIYGVAAAATLAVGLAWLEHGSHGWFWTYVFRLHQSHEFFAHRAYVETPLRLLKAQGPVLAAALLAAGGLALGRRLVRSDLLIGTAALAGLLAACIGFGTQWAFDNAFIPAVFFPALAAAVWTARLAQQGLRSGRGGALVVAALALGLLGAQSLRVPLPERARWVPGPADRTAARRFLQTVRGLEGPLFIPFHPFYAVLAGRPAHLHRMGVWDVAATYGRPRGLDDAIASERFDHIVLDWKSRLFEWPGLEAHYQITQELRDGFDSVRSFSGAETSPRWILTARRLLPP